MSQQFLVLVFSILLLVTLSLVVLLSLSLRRTSLQSSQILMMLLERKTLEAQSLLNQVRALDPMTLHSLNYATNVPSRSEDDNIFVEQDGYGDEEEGTLDDDLAANGWSASEHGGEPVVFGRG